MPKRCTKIHPSGERCALEDGHKGNHRLQEAHRCHARDCQVRVRPEMLMCLAHWRRVPKNIQRAVWATYRHGQCDDKDPSEPWHEAADAAIGFVAWAEGKVVRSSEKTALGKFGFEMGQIEKALGASKGGGK